MRKPKGWSQPCPNPACRSYRLLQRGIGASLVVLGLPCFFSAGDSGSLSALVEGYHTLQTCLRPGKPGRPRTPVQVPAPELAYGQVVQKQQTGRLQARGYRGRGGAERLEALGYVSSTSVIARRNRTWRHALAPLARNSWRYCQERIQLRRRVVFWQAFSNFARPHMRVRGPLPEQAPCSSGLIHPKWFHRTPAMAAGLTDEGDTQADQTHTRGIEQAQCYGIQKC